MKHHRVISTAVLFLLLGTTLPAFAQNAKDDQGGAAPTTPQSQPQPTSVPQSQQQPTSVPPSQPQPPRVPQAQSQPTRVPQSQLQPTRVPSSQPQPTRVQNVPPQPTTNNSGGHGNPYGRISNANYRAHFGQSHSFHMMRPRMIGGFHRFQYGGYWFGFNQGWPSGWSYGDTCYVVYNGGAYYLNNLSHPDIHVTLRMF